MKAIVTIIGKDKIGIISKVSTTLAKHNINIMDINQTIMQEFFTMIMLVDLENMNVDFKTISSCLSTLGESIGVDIRIQHEKIFTSMYEV